MDIESITIYPLKKGYRNNKNEMRKLKILLIGMLIITSTSAYSQSEPAKYVTNTDTERLIDKYTEKIEAGILVISEKLKQPAEHVYGVMLKQQVIRGWSWALAMGGGIVLSLLFFAIGNRLEKQGEHDGLYGTCYFLCVFFGIVAFIGFVGFLTTGLSSIINPGYKVINEIVEWIK